MRKSERQQLIIRLIADRAISTQEQLVEALATSGAGITQATVSRDLREIGVQKGPAPDGGIRYVVPSRQGRSPEKALAAALAGSGASAHQAQNLVVVRCEPGSAPSLGRLIDELEHEDVVGTVAGDDTVLMALKNNGGAERMTRYINGLAGR